MLKLVLLACVAALVVAQTRPPHQNHIPHGAFTFFVDAHLGDMVMVSQSHCFLLSMTDADIKMSHNPAELEKLEFKMVALAADPSNYHNVTGQTDRMVHARCHNKALTELS